MIVLSSTLSRINHLPHELAAGTVKVVFHSFSFIGPESEAAARAAWAAAEQGRFWDMWATIYANQGPRENDGSFDRDRLLAMADALHRPDD